MNFKALRGVLVVVLGVGGGTRGKRSVEEGGRRNEKTPQRRIRFPRKGAGRNRIKKGLLDFQGFPIKDLF